MALATAQTCASPSSARRANLLISPARVRLAVRAQWAEILVIGGASSDPPAAAGSLGIVEFHFVTHADIQARAAICASDRREWKRPAP